MMKNVLLLCALLAAPASVHGQLIHGPGREVSFPRQQIGESFLAWLAGAIQEDLPAGVDRRDLQDMFPEFRGKSETAFQLMRTVERQTAVAAAPPRLIFSFSGPLHVPVPFVVPWYHPISIDASDTVVLTEERIASRVLPGEGDRDVVLSPLYLYRVRSGFGGIHFEEWLTVLSAGLLTDFTVKGAALFRWRGEWHGFICGSSPRGAVVSWLFNLTRMRLVFPQPRQYTRLARDLAAGE
jgi:hypothetical protein